MKNKVLKWAAGVALAAAAYFLGNVTPEVNLSGAIGLDAVYATSTLAAVPAAGTVSTLMASSSCAMRVVSTKSSPIMLTFSDEAPTVLKSTLQPASTTTRYPSEEFGCGAMKAITGDSAASVVTVVEFR